jgi:hypothetical protein
MMLQDGLQELLFTAGILISLIMLVIGIIKNRKGIKHAITENGFEKKDIIIVAAILIVFLFIELYYIRPTQLLFFDDAIYQAMALMLLHTGQAWMCNYGTPTACFSGQLFHEPIGLSFNIAVAYLLLGPTRAASWDAELALGSISVVMGFFASLLLLKNKKAAFFTELLLALSPIILIWSRATNSDIAVLAYSLICLFFFLVFMKNRKFWDFSNMLFSFSLLYYMKVDEIFFIPVFIAFYIVLDDKGVRKAIANMFKTIKKNIFNTKLLIICLIFMLVIIPAILYTFNESATDGYGWQGTVIQNTCRTGLPPLNVTSEINILNFKANVCSNILFWFNNYRSQYVIQPIVYTALAILGVALMIITKKERRVLVAIAIWFAVFFLLYSAFYAGSVIYGVDWRFMLSLIAQTCMLGGFAAACILDTIDMYVKKMAKYEKTINIIAASVLVIVIFVPLYLALPLLSVNPALIQQAGDARFYENFVYNNSKLIPANCIVYTYDPTLFQLNNRTATQMSNLYNETQVQQYESQYKCLVLDYGYWCHTPNNECTYVLQNYNLTLIANATYNSLNYNYGFYYINENSINNT